MFQFSGLAPFGNIPSEYWVAPFGNLRITGYFHLTVAYRRLSRPSSPLRAKASSIRPCLLSLYFTSNLYYPIQYVKERFPIKGKRVEYRNRTGNLSRLSRDCSSNELIHQEKRTCQSCYTFAGALVVKKWR